LRPINIAIIDDHPMVLAGISTLLKPFPHIQIIGNYTHADELMKGLKEACPDVLLLDLALPDKTGKIVASEVLKLYPDIKILVLTSMDTPAMVSSMMRRGCKGYLLKGAEPQLMADAINTIFAGHTFLDKELKEQLVLDAINTKKSTKKDHLLDTHLSEKEIEILKLIAEEYTTKEISKQLNIGFRTAENYRYNLIKKLDVKNTAGLVKVALQLGLIKNQLDDFN
jgi:DNA-binding NarL/FixJ family response regulator